MNLWPDYYKQVEDFIIKFDYLYSGDVISSSDKSTSFNLNLDKISTTAITRLINNIYQDSILDMINRTNDIKTFDLSNIDNAIKSTVNYKYAFVNKNFLNHINAGSFRFSIPVEPVHWKAFDAMYKKYTFGTLDIYCIDDILTDEELNSEDDMIIYLTDRPIQSLIYTMNTTSYEIKNNNHKIEYKVFNCDFKSRKIVIRNLEVDRDIKIDSLINDKTTQ